MSEKVVCVLLNAFALAAGLIYRRIQKHMNAMGELYERVNRLEYLGCLESLRDLRLSTNRDEDDRFCSRLPLPEEVPFVYEFALIGVGVLVIFTFVYGVLSVLCAGCDYMLSDDDTQPVASPPVAENEPPVTPPPPRRKLSGRRPYYTPGGQI